MAQPHQAPAAFPISVKGVVVRDGRVLLLRNERDEWELPGGKLHSGESPEHCVAREIAEETGWTVTTGTILDSWMYHIEAVNKDVFIVTYGCYPISSTTPVLSSEHAEVGLFTKAEVPALTMPDGYKRSIAAWFALLREGEREAVGQEEAKVIVMRRRCEACATELSRYATEPVCPTCDVTYRHRPPVKPSGGLPSALWLWSSAEAADALATRDLGVILRTYRHLNGLSQEKLATLLGYDKTYVSMIETGRRVINDTATRRHIADTLVLPSHTLGITDITDADFAAIIQSPTPPSGSPRSHAKPGGPLRPSTSCGRWLPGWKPAPLKAISNAKPSSCSGRAAWRSGYL